MTFMTILKAFSHRSFTLLWSGQIISRLGDSLNTIALALWVLQKTGSATVMGGVLICTTIPMLLFLLFGGVAVDRFPRIYLMLASDVLRALLMLLIAFLVFQAWLQLWELFVLSALFGVVEAFFYPAYSALIPDLVTSEILPSANSLRTIGTNMAQVVGPAIGAALILWGGTSLAFALDGVSFLLSAACLLAIPKVLALRQPIQKGENALQDITTGLQAVVNSPWLWVTLAVASVSTIFLIGPSDAALPLLVKQRFGAQVSVSLFGLLNALSSVGSISAALILGHFKRLRRRGLLIYGAWMIASLMLTIIGLPISAFWVCLAFLVQGMSLTTLGLSWVNTLQEFVPAELLGRVFSIDMLVSSGLLPIGYGLAGIAADHFGASPVFVLGGLISTGVIALGLLHPTIRTVD
jgi:MFS family permease